MIYQPTGRAKEYSSWALNIYQGCIHGCTYCYAPRVLHKKKEAFHEVCTVRKDFHGRLAQSLKRWKGLRNIQVLLCFTCDPYQPCERETLATRKTIQMLHEAGMNVCVLTKSPTLAYRDIDLYKEGDAFATTLTFSKDQFVKSVEVEPLAELPHQRIMGLKAFASAGIKTWVSLEPILDVTSVLANIYDTHYFVDHYKVGKLNYQESDIDWILATRTIVKTLECLGKKYYLKEDLRKYL